MPQWCLAMTRHHNFNTFFFLQQLLSTLHEPYKRKHDYLLPSQAGSQVSKSINSSELYGHPVHQVKGLVEGSGGDRVTPALRGLSMEADGAVVRPQAGFG